MKHPNNRVDHILQRHYESQLPPTTETSPSYLPIFSSETLGLLIVINFLISFSTFVLLATRVCVSAIVNGRRKPRPDAIRIGRKRRTGRSSRRKSRHRHLQQPSPECRTQPTRRSTPSDRSTRAQLPSETGRQRLQDSQRESWGSTTWESRSQYSNFTDRPANV